MKTLSLVLLWAAMAAGQTLVPPKKCESGFYRQTPIGTLVCMDESRSVPAVRKTRRVEARWQGCSYGMICGNETLVPEHDEPYWTCDDPSIPGGADRALIPSENGKKAMCLLVE